MPLRCAPVIVREIRLAFNLLPMLHDYSDGSLAAPGDGMRVRHLGHRGNDGDHDAGGPVECVQCGRDVATELRALLGDATGRVQSSKAV